VMRREQQQGGDIDLMLLDINMPHMNGFEVLEDMRNDPRLAHIPVIMCTGSKYGPDRQRAMQLGALDYLEKPPFFDQLRPVLERIEGLELYSMEDGGCRLVRIF